MTPPNADNAPLNLTDEQKDAAKAVLAKIYNALYYSPGGDVDPEEFVEAVDKIFADLLGDRPVVYHAFEACTDDSYFIWVDKDKHKMERRLEGVLDLAGIVPDTTITGTVTADSIEGAIEAVRAGNWNCT